MRRTRIFYPRSRPQIVDQFLRFGIVGALGFFVDWASVDLLRPEIGLIAATIGAYFTAATFNWALNRLWTFRSTATDNQHLILQWLHFLLANSFGFLLNRGAVFLLYALVPFTVTYPVVALAIGAGCGMLANFNLSRRLVFRAKVPETPMELVQMAVEIPAAGLTSPEPEPQIPLSQENSEIFQQKAP
ncbi:GtrA family protein [Gluconobacter japonicus]|uniref:GtrA family protein n=1 Tax=Gluconobacter japonicus TaxID=376620 RepID=UPI0007825DF2|nr:GtrA family protein [Gluconobacter japonicus]KXV21674.1 polysaccharide biosynthesis protein GtrA [Gluconobacter japonicus]